MVTNCTPMTSASRMQLFCVGFILMVGISIALVRWYVYPFSNKRDQSAIVSTCDSGQPNTTRIGNLVDAWFAASLGSNERREQFSILKSQSDDGSFGKHLEIKYPHEIAPTMQPDDIRKYVRNSDAFWAVYDYDNIRPALFDFRMSLRRECDKYMSTLDYILPEYDIVIHYRVGDFLTISKPIDPNSIVRVVRGLGLTRDVRVAILDGGMSHFTTDHTRSQSQRLKQQIHEGCLRLGDNFTVESVSISVDMDFMLCVYAPVLITGAGSFAVTAAIGNTTGIIRTPACGNTNFCSNSRQRAAELIADNWSTYRFDCVDL